MLVEMANLLNRHFKKYLIWRHWCFGFLQNHPKVRQKDSQLRITADISRIPRRKRKLIDMNQVNLQSLPSRRHCKTEKRRNKWWWWNLGKLSFWRPLLAFEPNLKMQRSKTIFQITCSYISLPLFPLEGLPGAQNRRTVFCCVVRHLAGLESPPTCSTSLFCPFESQNWRLHSWHCPCSLHPDESFTDQ